MAFSENELKKLLETLIAGLEKAKDEKHLEWDFYSTLYPEDIAEARYEDDYEDLGGNSLDDDIAIAAAKHPALHPLMRKIVDLVTEINNKIHIQWMDDESHAAAGMARELALANKEDIILYSRYLSSNDLNHEVYQAEDIDAILSKWEPCKEIYALAAARWFTPGQHKTEQGLENIEVADEKAADELLAMTAKWFIEGWFEPYSPKDARRDYFEAHVQEDVQEFFEMFLTDLAGQDNIETITENFTAQIYKGHTPTLKELMHKRESNYLTDVKPIKETVPIIIDRSEFKKRGLEKGDVEDSDESKFYLFYDYDIPNPFIRAHVEDQWAEIEDMSGINGQRWNHYRALKLGDYYVDLVNIPCNYGLVLYDGQHEPLILYGVLDYVAILKKYFSKSKKGSLGDEEKRKEILEAQTKYVVHLPTPLKTKPVVQPQSEIYYDELYDSILLEKDYDKALKYINGMDKNAPEYPSSVIDRLVVMEAKENWPEAVKACEELVELIPELKDHWNTEKERFQAMTN